MSKTPASRTDKTFKGPYPKFVYEKLLKKDKEVAEVYKRDYNAHILEEVEQDILK